MINPPARPLARALLLINVVAIAATIGLPAWMLCERGLPSWLALRSHGLAIVT